MSLTIAMLYGIVAGDAGDVRVGRRGVDAMMRNSLSTCAFQIALGLQVVEAVRGGDVDDEGGRCSNSMSGETRSLQVRSVKIWVAVNFLDILVLVFLEAHGQ